MGSARVRFLRIAFGVSAALVRAVVVTASPVPSPPPAPQAATCSFSNPVFSGFCRVTPKVPAGGSAKKACLGVLACLNDTRCIHTYCNATTIRVGWKLESVALAPPPPNR